MGLTVQQFDYIYNKKIAKRYAKYKILNYLKEKMGKENQDLEDRSNLI